MPDAPARLARLLERTARLHRLTARMSAALTAAEVAQIAVDDSTEALGANSVGLWRAEGDHLELVRANNYPQATLAYVQSIAIDAQSPVADALRTGTAVWLSSRAEYEERYVGAAARSRSVAPESYSVASLPIVVHGEVLGVIVVTFLLERTFDEDERSYLSFLALHCAQGFERVRLYERELQARYLAEAAQARAVFLARASGLLGSSLDYEATLRNVASLAVPEVGDWCAIELVDEDGEAKQVAVAHIDPAKIELAHELRRRYPPARDAPTGVPNVLRTGTSELYREITDEMLVAGSRDADHLRFARELGLSSVLIVAIKDRGAVLGAISFVLANTSRRYVDDDLRMAEQLAERAGAAISNAKLYAAAQTAIRVRDDFMLIAGHELRTPLSALSLHGEALERVREAWPVEKVRERGMKLRIQTERIRRLVEDLLDVSRISAGRLSLELEELDFGAHVAEIIERMRDEFERARSPITLAAEPVRGRWDRSRTDQIITNLLANAAKYGRGTPIDVRVTSTPGKVDFAVTDRGIGIAPEDQPRIFKRFERAVSSRNFGGLGLGLWITSQLVEAHGGTIAVTSVPGAGATFTVSLPVT